MLVKASDYKRSGMFIPDSKFFIPDPDQTFFISQILDPDKNSSRIQIPDQEGKTAPDPRYGTLLTVI
jgi:hypothetical protein